MKEGFGLAAMEALAAGVPLVTRDLPVLREVFGGTARFATDPPELATQLAAAARHPDPRRQERGRTLSHRHTWRRAAQAHVDLYCRLVGADQPASQPDPNSARSADPCSSSAGAAGRTTGSS